MEKSHIIPTHLGITLNEILPWDNHVNDIVKRTTSLILLLKHMKKFTDRNSKLPVYTTFFQPKPEYVSMVFYTQLTYTQSDRLENIQHKALLACIAAYACKSHKHFTQRCWIKAVIAP